MDVVSAWSRIEAWLAIHAPHELASLRPGACDDILQIFEDELGHAVPADLRASLARHDGQEPGGHVMWHGDTYRLLPIDEVLDRCRGRALAAGAPVPPAMPIAETRDGHLVVGELRSGALLAVGHDRYLDHYRRPAIVASSFGAWLHQHAADLDAGRYVVSTYGLARRWPTDDELDALVAAAVRKVVAQGGDREAVVDHVAASLDQPAWVIRQAHGLGPLELMYALDDARRATSRRRR